MMNRLLRGILLLSAVFLSTSSTSDIYSIKLKDIEGKNVSMEDYRGKVLLIVNVATYCGYTDSNYRSLVWLQATYHPEGFEVLGFPCNQFGSQEPDSHADILKFATSNYNLNFRLFSKSNVIGEERNELYEYLYKKTGSVPTWNFAKYLVDQNGEVVQFFDTKAKDEDIHRSIRYLVSKGKDGM